MKNEKFLLYIQTKCSDIANKILNVAIDAEQTFKCKWPKGVLIDLHVHNFVHVKTLLFACMLVTACNFSSSVQAFNNCLHIYDHAHNMHAKEVSCLRKFVHGIDFCA